MHSKERCKDLVAVLLSGAPTTSKGNEGLNHETANRYDRKPVPIFSRDWFDITLWKATLNEVHKALSILILHSAAVSSDGEACRQQDIFWTTRLGSSSLAHWRLFFYSKQWPRMQRY